MGVFFEQIEVVNRTSEPLQIMYDGQRVVLEPNYTADGKRIEGVHNMVPKQVVPYALNQTVILGSENVKNPTNFRSKIGVIDRKDKKARSWHDCSFFDLKEETEITRVTQQDILDEYAEPGAKVVTRGKRRHRSEDMAIDMPTTPFDLRPA